MTHDLRERLRSLKTIVTALPMASGMSAQMEPQTFTIRAYSAGQGIPLLTEEQIDKLLPELQSLLDEREAKLKRDNAILSGALQEIQEVASGEKQVAIDDTAGMGWIDKRAQAAQEAAK